MYASFRGHCILIYWFEFINKFGKLLLIPFKEMLELLDASFIKCNWEVLNSLHQHLKA